MFGRTSERAVLRTQLDRARSGHGQSVMIIGEPGIGKSMLLGDLARYAQAADVVVLTGRAVEGAGTLRPIAEALMPPLRSGALPDPAELGPYRPALGRLLPDWSTPSIPETTVDPVLVLGEGLLRLLLALGPECVLLIEDLHWADAETLALLDYLTGAIVDSPVLIAATVRKRPWSPGLARLIRATPTVIELGRLEPADIDTMIEQSGVALTPAENALVRERSEGLPLLVEELLASASARPPGAGSPDWTVPASFAAVVQARLAVLEPQGRRLMSAAATLGSQPDWDLVPSIAGVDAAEAVTQLRRAVAVDLLINEGPVLGWRHALTRDAIWGGLLPPERAAFGRRAAEVLLARGGPECELAAADLLVQAGDVDAGSALLLRVSDRELAAGAVHSAEFLLDRLAGIGRTEAGLASRRVDLLSLTGQLEQAMDVGLAGLEIAAGDDHAELCLRLARVADPASPLGGGRSAGGPGPAPGGSPVADLVGRFGSRGRPDPGGRRVGDPSGRAGGGSR